MEGSSFTYKDRVLWQDTSEVKGPIFEISLFNDNSEVLRYFTPELYYSLSNNEDDRDDWIASNEIREE